MINGYYSTTGGMITQFNRLDVISNNLANLNTNGFKRDDVVVGDFLRLYKQTQDTLPIKDHTRAAAQYQNRNLNRVPNISEEYTEFETGAMAQTDNPLDFALQKPNTYFAIQTPDGIRYTKDGSFTIDNDGFLSTKQGYRVLSRAGIESEGGILIAQGLQVEADKNGNLYFRNPGNEEINAPIAGGSLAIVSFDNPKYLQKVGDNLFKYPDERLDDRIIAIDNGSLVQGFVEKSNVNAVKEMSALIETNRLVDMYSRAMRTYMDDFAPEAISKLAVRA
ncbi:flagellar hook-basal body protein [uncultured Helicobacter sp.]|uniref:flagellar hook-basal body protein n=1 Tax=uncultured Helicobacter sp. TaxID=175537 RepID=UPI002588C475|nr:flagellar hook-basal body protein [uncultured Helicobacter sp.]